MGWMRFQVSQRHRIVDDTLSQVYMCGLDEVPWRTKASWDDDQLVVERFENDSGNLHIPWETDSLGNLALSTGCLMERDRPYQLEVELARGTLHTLRNQLAAWQLAGLVAPNSITQQLRQATQLFSQAATSQHDPPLAAETACEAIEATLETIDDLSVSYVQQAIAVRSRQSAPLPTLLGVNLGLRPLQQSAAEQVAETFNTAVVPFPWRKIEVGEGQQDFEPVDQQLAWCTGRGLRVCSGPLLQFDSDGFPDWLYLWEGDFENLVTFAVEHVQSLVRRYRNQVQLWQVAGRVNRDQLLSLTEEQRLRMVVHAIEAVRREDSRTPIVVSFDQPWGEYLGQAEHDLPPWQFADALVRADLGISGLGLEINAGYHPQGSWHRHPLDYSRLLDRWSMLGLPLLLSVTTPSGTGDDARATSPARPLATDATPQTQQAWAERYLPLMLAKNCVQVLVWNQLQDAEKHDYLFGGLIDLSGDCKPAMETLGQLKAKYLN